MTIRSIYAKVYNMKICYFGIYNANHTRNRLMIKGLRDNGVAVAECNTREQSLRKYWYLVKRHWAVRKQYDVMVVGFPGHTVMPLAWLLATLHGKKLIFDAFISQYDSIIFDERKYPERSFHAAKFWFLDWISCILADAVLLEVQAYADYFAETFKISKKKFHVIFVGCDDTVIFPREQHKDTDDFLVHFHGTYIPAQGIPYIIDAARSLMHEHVHFNIIGRRDHYAGVIEDSKKRGINNITFIDFVPYATLADYMAQADACLGMFGNTEKAKRAGAFKIIEAMAMRKPLVTADTPAIREFLTDGETALLTPVADGKAIADAILKLKNDPALRQKLAGNGYALFRKRMTPRALGAQLTALCAEQLGDSKT